MPDDKKQFERDPNEIGALWNKTSNKGDFMTGKIEGQDVVIFKNNKKREGSNQPDWRVLKSVPREGQNTQAPAPAHREEEPRLPDLEEGDIPF